MPIADVARLLDAAHAAVVERVVRLLGAEAWEIVVEYTFNDYGERGSVDVLAWRDAARALLMVEAKTRIADVQDLHATFDRKARVVPKLVARERGWRPALAGMLLVVAESHANREAVRAHTATFAARFPAGSREARRWIREPDGDFAGLLFLPDLGVSQRNHASSRPRAG